MAMSNHLPPLLLLLLVVADEDNHVAAPVMFTSLPSSVMLPRLASYSFYLSYMVSRFQWLCCFDMSYTLTDVRRCLHRVVCE